MKLQLIFLLVTISAAFASSVQKDDDLQAAEGKVHYARQFAPREPSPSAQNPLYSSSVYSSPRQGGHVTSYNRRGSSSEYGLRFNGPSSSGSNDYAPSAPAYAAGPALAPYGHQQDERGYGIGGSRYGSGGYGPSNAISNREQQYSQDPEYDPSKDPVSQYAAYIPVREYGPKKDSHREALSIYGYRK